MLSRTGWTALFASVILLAISAWLSYIELAALAVAGLLAVGVGFAWILFRPRVEVEHRVTPLRLTAGDSSRAEVIVTNTGTRPSLPLIAIDRVASAGVELALPRLPPRASTTLGYELPTSRRAVLQVGPLEINRADPFGFVRFDQRHGHPVTVYIHPRRHRLRALPASLERSLDGPTSDTARGSQVFHALREYVPGDDRRMIHWKTSARTGTLMVREHVDTSLPDLTILLDTRRSHHNLNSFEQAVEVAASLTSACAGQGFPVRLRTTNGLTFEPMGGEEATTFFLDRLAGAELSDTGELVALAQSMQSGRAGLALVVVTGHPTQADVRALNPLVRQYDSVTIVDLNPDANERFSGPGIDRIEAATSLEFAELWNSGAR